MPSQAVRRVSCKDVTLLTACSVNTAFAISLYMVFTARLSPLRPSRDVRCRVRVAHLRSVDDIPGSAHNRLYFVYILLALKNSTNIQYTESKKRAMRAKSKQLRPVRHRLLTTRLAIPSQSVPSRIVVVRIMWLRGQRCCLRLEMYGWCSKTRRRD